MNSGKIPVTAQPQKKIAARPHSEPGVVQRGQRQDDRNQRHDDRQRRAARSRSDSAGIAERRDRRRNPERAHQPAHRLRVVLAHLSQVERHEGPAHHEIRHQQHANQRAQHDVPVVEHRPQRAPAAGRAFQAPRLRWRGAALGRPAIEGFAGLRAHRAPAPESPTPSTAPPTTPGAPAKKERMPPPKRRSKRARAPPVPQTTPADSTQSPASPPSQARDAAHPLRSQSVTG